MRALHLMGFGCDGVMIKLVLVILGLVSLWVLCCAGLVVLTAICRRTGRQVVVLKGIYVLVELRRTPVHVIL